MEEAPDPAAPGAPAPEGLATRLIHHPYTAPPGFGAVPVGVHRASTVLFETVAELHGRSWLDKQAYTYGLHGTPTTFTLEERLAALEGGTHALLTPSGLAAVALVDQTFLAQGQAVLLPDNVYAPNRNLALHELLRWGIEHRIYDPMRPETLEAALAEDVALVWIEAPGSVTLEFPDVPALVQVVRERAPAAVVAMDTTWAAGVAYCGFDLGADLTIHALTKYPSGGADVLMGSVVTRRADLRERLSWTHSRLGLGVGASDAELVLRGLPTLALRYAAQDASARRIAGWARGRPEIARVLHPALPDSPGHLNWMRLARGAASLLTLEFAPRYRPEDVDRVVEALRRFGIGWSWAGPMSLAVPYRPEGLRRLASRYRGTLVRLAIGLEDCDDLLADLEQALATLPPG